MPEEMMQKAAATTEPDLSFTAQPSKEWVSLFSPSMARLAPLEGADGRPCYPTMAWIQQRAETDSFTWNSLTKTDQRYLTFLYSRGVKSTDTPEKRAECFQCLLWGTGPEERKQREIVAAELVEEQRFVGGYRRLLWCLSWSSELREESANEGTETE